jgi:glycosyltransferase involved in cell wall biosynthesis
MKILIPTILSTKNKVGVSEYLIGLINSLQQIDHTNEYFIITTNENRHFFNLTICNFHEIVVNIFDISRASLRLQYLFFSKFRIPSLVKKHKIDLIHEPCSWFINKKLTTIVTIHDIVEINNPKYSFLFNFIKRKMILSSINNSTAIISVSKQTTKEIKEIKNRNFYTIYNGISHIKKSEFEIDLNVLEKYNLKSKQYFIFVGTLLKHKNLLSLLEAFRRFNNANSYFKLVLAGKEGNSIKRLQDFIKKYSLENQIILTGYFEDNEKSSLIKNAASLLLVSKNEGFGFPILEAQALGVPVITSNTSSMKEISNDSAILIDPNSIESITKAMLEVVKNDGLVSKLIILGYKNANRFSWNKAALSTIEVYKKVFAQNNSLNK